MYFISNIVYYFRQMMKSMRLKMPYREFLNILTWKGVHRCLLLVFHHTNISKVTLKGRLFSPTAHISPTANFSGGYMLFLNMMNPHDEYTYDLLPWAIENYTVSLMNPSTTKPPPNSNDPLHSAAAAVESVSLSNSNAASSLRNAKKAMKKVLKDFPPLSEFILSLSNHFRATPALIRYGACVALHSALLVCPTLVQDFKQLYAFIVSGALDTDYLSAFLYTSMLDVVKSDAALIAGQTLVSSSSPPHTTPHGGALVESPHVNTGISVMVEQYRHKENETMTYDQLYIFDYQSGDDTQSITLSDILSDAVKNSPPLSSKLLHRVANSLEYMSKPMKMKQLELLKVWATKIDKVREYEF